MLLLSHIFLSCVLTISIKIVSADDTVKYNVHPDTGLNISQLLEKYGYPFENHVIQTQDGYVLSIHRVPYGANNSSRDPNKPVVLLVHGMGSQSADFVNNEPQRSLGLLLADRGYDVWLLNCRGNTYSRKHIKYDPDKNKKSFWDFSWHEVGVYDLPSSIDYILGVTKQEKLFYIGHSQGTTAFFVMGSVVPEYNAKIRHMAALGASAFYSNNHNVWLRALARSLKALQLGATVLGIHEFWRHSNVYLDMVEEFCLEGMETFDTCQQLYELFNGKSPEMNATMWPVYVSNSPSGFSVKEGFHYLQSFNNGEYFRQYDYGKLRNRIKYGSVKPPDYNLTNIVAPVTIHYSEGDKLCDIEDVEVLISRLPNVNKRLVPLKEFGHLDYIFGMHAKTLLYDYMFAEMENH